MEETTGAAARDQMPLVCQKLAAAAAFFAIARETGRERARASESESAALCLLWARATQGQAAVYPVGGTSSHTWGFGNVLSSQREVIFFSPADL